MTLDNIELADEIIASLMDKKSARLSASDADKFMQIFGGDVVPISKDYVLLYPPKNFWRGLTCQVADHFDKYSAQTMELWADAWSAYQEGACPRLFSTTPPLDSGDLPYNEFNEIIKLLKEQKGHLVKLFSVTGSWRWLFSLKRKLLHVGLKEWDDFIIFKISETHFEPV